MWISIFAFDEEHRYESVRYWLREILVARPVVRFKDVWKLYGNLPVVSNLNLEIKDNEFLVFVGPSGCGKSTSLRMLTGLESVTHGAVLFGDDDVTMLPSGKRDISMVFQSYALYPNMTVANNLSFGPTVRREDKVNLPKRIEEVSKIVG
jgi:multiple sugar transport system ATP-binding protein